MTDVLVVGAGLSGLVCARRLADAGRDVLVLEAAATVGGRLRAVELDGSVFDLGAQWMSAEQPRLAALAAELGVASYPQARDGGAVLALAAAPPRRLVGRAVAALARRRQLGALSRLIGEAARRPDPAWDRASLGAWLDGNVADPATREQLQLHVELTFAADPHALSLHGYLTDLAAQPGDPFRGEGGRERRFVGGAHRLAASLAAGLGERICLATPVRAIARARDHVIVASARGELRAARVVLALPPARARAIELTPALPAAAAQVIARSAPGAVVKLVVTYPRAFWRDHGLSGEAYASAGLVRATVDASVPGGAAALIGFVVADAATRWREQPLEARRAQVLAELAALFGPEAAHPRAFACVDWSADPWTGGCVAGLPPGAAVAAPAWRGPFDRLHIAGTESARSWPGFLEGAIEAGERAAAEILSDGG